jgi:hypothetical protein
VPKWVKGVGTAVLVPILVGYVIEWVKGTPPSKIAGVLWAPIGSAISATTGWLRAPTQTPRGWLLFLTLVFAWTLVVRIARWLRARTQKIPEEFDPTPVQMTALAWLLKKYGSPQTLDQLDAQTGYLTTRAGGVAFLEREMEGLLSASLVRSRTFQGRTFYELPSHGRDWLLDELQRSINKAPPPTGS